MPFWPNHPKSDQNVWFTPQSKTMSIPDPFKEVSPPRTVTLMLVLKNHYCCFWTLTTANPSSDCPARPLNNVPGVIDYPSYYTGFNRNNCVDGWLRAGVCDFNMDNLCLPRGIFPNQLRPHPSIYRKCLTAIHRTASIVCAWLSYRHLCPRVVRIADGSLPEVSRLPVGLQCC